MIPLTRKNIPSLTGIRGAAALLVLLFHIPLNDMYGLTATVPILRNGFYGVDLFFILSGFILFHVHERDFHNLTPASIRSFFIVRFWRVYPLHFIVLAGIVAFVVASPGFVTWFRSLPAYHDAFSPAGLVQTLTLTNRVGIPSLGEWNPPSWSLSSEAAGYAAFPLLAWGLAKVKRLWPCYLGVGFLLGAFAVIGYHVQWAGVVRMALCFPAGMLLARAYHLRSQVPTLKHLATVSSIASLACLAVDALAPLAPIAFAGLIYGLALDEGAASRLLSSRLSMFLGRVSFSLYLSHFILINAVIWLVWGGTVHTAYPTLVTLGFVAICLVLATFLYRTIEAPSHRIGRALAGRSSSARGSSLNASE